ncbi:MAG: hypothetical protein JWM10_2994 [Myxococcaceae bacterium]|nr:hypothetical protein [Myxococcaceae bacterium]
MNRTWTRDTAVGDTVTLNVGRAGIAVSVLAIDGRREGHTGSLEAFEEEWASWLSAPFADAMEEIREAVGYARGAADDDDDLIP